MKIAAIHYRGLGPLTEGTLDFTNDWTREVESCVLLSGVNGSGKSTVLNACAVLWEALGHWLYRRKPLSSKDKIYKKLSLFTGVAISLVQTEAFVSQGEGPQHVIIGFGDASWLTHIRDTHPADLFMAQISINLSKKSSSLMIDGDKSHLWLDELSERYLQLKQTFKTLNFPNMTYLDAEARRWQAPKRNIGHIENDDLSLRWLNCYLSSTDWNDSLEASLIRLKTQELHKYHDVIRNLNRFLVGKAILPDIAYGETRLRVKLHARRQATHYLDELSSGERQLLIVMYALLRWMQPGGIVLIDEPDMFLHPSLIPQLLQAIEVVVAEQHGQLILTSHLPSVWERYERSGLRIELTDLIN